MAEVQPFRALHYDLERTGGLQAVAAPPYDVIDADQRAALVARSPHNVVEIDLPVDPAGGDPYAHAAATLDAWRSDGVLARDDEPALWALEQGYTGPDGHRRTRRGFFARVRVEDYGPGRIRPHERTHPGPKEDRLRLTRATRANLSPIFSLYDDPAGAAWGAVEPHLAGAPWGEVSDEDGTRHRLWRVSDAGAGEAVRETLRDTELLIADGHHRYETARVFHEEGGAGHVLMCLVSLQDPGLTVFPTHRLLTGLKDDSAKQQAIRETLTRDFEVEEVGAGELSPDGARERTEFGYMDSFHRQPYRAVLKDQAIADAASSTEPYASGRPANFATRPPYQSPVDPSSPLRV